MSDELTSMKAPWQQDGKGIAGDAIKIFAQSAATQLSVDAAASSVSAMQPMAQQPTPLNPADLMRPTASGGTAAGGVKKLIVGDNGTLNFYNFAATFVGAV